MAQHSLDNDDDDTVPVLVPRVRARENVRIEFSRKATVMACIIEYSLK